MRTTNTRNPVVLLLVFTLLGSSPWLATAADGKASQNRKLLEAAKSITLPQFKLEDVTLDVAVRQLQAAGKRYDAEHRGVNFLLLDSAKGKATPTVTLDLKGVS